MQLALLDPTHTSWWLQVTPAGELTVHSTLALTLREPVIQPNPIRYIEVRVSDDVVWYVTVDSMGLVQTSTTQPGISGIPGPLQLYDTSGEPWGLRVTQAGEVQLVSGYLTSYEEGTYCRLCSAHRLAFDPDPRIHLGSGKVCPCGGEKLVGWLARFRDEQGLPGENFVAPWDITP